MIPMRSLAVGTAAALAVAAAFASSTSAGSPVSGLVGKVVRGSTQPVCTAYRPCTPTASVALAFFRNGAEVGRVRSGQGGRYRITLAPGVYTVRPTFRHPLWKLGPRTVRVPAGNYAIVNFHLETGIT